MEVQLHITNLTKEKRYTVSLTARVNKKSSITCHQLKMELGNVMRTNPVTFDILNISDVVLYNNDYIFTFEDVMNIILVVHPENRGASIPDHLSTADQDMINGEMGDLTRILMSCGHAITPDNLYEYCWQMLLQGKLEFTCPNVNAVYHTNVNICGAVWTLYEVITKARLTQDETILFEMKLNHNFCRGNGGIRTCPFCGVICERLHKESNKVVCQECISGGNPQHEFCWQCQKQWRSDTLVYCGNDSCESAKGVRTEQEMLYNARRKDFDTFTSCPTIRMCPKCTSFLEHETGCKHITCECGYQFCFVCLQPWGSHCNHYNNCNVAPIQNL